MKELSIDDRMHLQKELSLVAWQGKEKVKKYLEEKKKEYSLSSSEEYFLLISATPQEVEDYYNNCPELPR